MIVSNKTRVLFVLSAGFITFVGMLLAFANLTTLTLLLLVGLIMLAGALYTLGNDLKNKEEK